MALQVSINILGKSCFSFDLGLFPMMNIGRKRNQCRVAPRAFTNSGNKSGLNENALAWQQREKDRPTFSSCLKIPHFKVNYFPQIISSVLLSFGIANTMPSNACSVKILYILGKSSFLWLFEDPPGYGNNIRIYSRRSRI